MSHAETSSSIRELRRQLGMTQRAFAARVGVPQSTVYRWEAGLVSPNGRHMKAIHELGALHGFAFDPFAGPQRDANKMPPEEELATAALKLLREQIAFCETIERLRTSEEGGEVWDILADPVLQQRKKLVRFLDETARSNDRSFNFWKAVSVLKIFAWRDGARKTGSDRYVRSAQMNASPDSVRLGGE